MKLSELKGQDAIDAIADVIEPLSAIATDKRLRADFKKVADSDDRVTALGKVLPKAIKTHKADVIKVLAAVNRKTVKEYEAEATVPRIMADAFDVLTDEELFDFFG